MSHLAPHTPQWRGHLTVFARKEERVVMQSQCDKHPNEQAGNWQSDCTFKEEDVPAIVAALAGVAYLWEHIAIALRMPLTVIEECRDKGSDLTMKKLYNVLHTWVVGQHPNARQATLENLKAVLASPLVQHPLLASELEDKLKTLLHLPTTHSDVSGKSDYGSDAGRHSRRGSDAGWQSRRGSDAGTHNADYKSRRDRNSHSEGGSSGDDLDDGKEDSIMWKKGKLLGKGAYGKVWEGLLSSAQMVAVKEVELDTHNLERAKSVSMAIHIM